MKILNGSELAGFIKERQARVVQGFSHTPKLLIVRDSDNPVIMKYVGLKIQYGKDIGVDVIDYCAKDSNDIRRRILDANDDPTVSGIIIQLPIKNKMLTDELCNLIKPEKDVDGLGANAAHDSATATAILWLLAGYDINFAGKHIAIVGRGKLVGAPLYRMFLDSGYDVDLFHRGSDLTKLKQYDIIITATGVPGLVSDDLVKSGAVIVDAGTASENGVLKGDISESLRKRKDLLAVTPKIGGIGPLTIACLFEHVIS